ncbi:hypothetical protein Sxan_03170 [Streptomyces xanthophaeus]|uniref:Uncharacterized protein n=1 Tax=Streptomyces xanthophaeus TaxID=67385 RepID=A0A919L9G8_9ACTN|nr:hypothetical protein Sxan_03170 [Streptomyces xanthophaeus]
MPGTDELVPQPYQVGKIRHMPEPVGQESDTKIVTVAHGRCAGGGDRRGAMRAARLHPEEPLA